MVDKTPRRCPRRSQRVGCSAGLWTMATYRNSKSTKWTASNLLRWGWRLSERFDSTAEHMSHWAVVATMMPSRMGFVAQHVARVRKYTITTLHRRSNGPVYSFRQNVISRPATVCGSPYRSIKTRSSTEWAKKVSRCIAGCNFVNYAPI